MNKFTLLFVFMISNYFLFAGNLCFMKGDPGFRTYMTDEEIDNLKANEEVVFRYQALSLLLCGYYGVEYAVVKSLSAEQVSLIKKYYKENRYTACFYFYSKDYKLPLGLIGKKELGDEDQKNVTSVLLLDEFEIVVVDEPYENVDAEKRKVFVIKDGKWIKLDLKLNARNKENENVEMNFLHSPLPGETKLEDIHVYKLINESEAYCRATSVNHLIYLMKDYLRVNQNKKIQGELDALIIVSQNLIKDKKNK